MYIEGKNKWETSSKSNGKCRSMEVCEIDNGFLCKLSEYNEYSSEEGWKEDRKEKIVYSKTNPLEGVEETKKDDTVDISTMFAGMAKQMGTLMVK